MGAISASQKVPKKGKEFKCYACKNIFAIEEKKVSGRHNFCPSCAKKQYEEQEKTKDIKQVPFGTEQFKDNENLYTGDSKIVKYENVREVVNYILDLFNLDYTAYYSLVTLQVKQLIKNYNCTYQGIYLTLKYYYIFLENPIPEEPHIINVVATNYSKAIEEYKLQKYLITNADKLIKEKIPVINVCVNRLAQKQNNDYYNNKWRAYENMISVDDIEITEENDDL